jgi:hypothetical protein
MRHPDGISDTLTKMMQAAERLQDAPSRITKEELDLLNECSSRLRLVRTLPEMPKNDLTLPSLTRRAAV